MNIENEKLFLRDMIQHYYHISHKNSLYFNKTKEFYVEQIIRLQSKQKAALSQIEYLENKYIEINKQISALEKRQKEHDYNLHELYFQKGKIYADLELMRRVPKYED